MGRVVAGRWTRRCACIRPALWVDTIEPLRTQEAAHPALGEVVLAEISLWDGTWGAASTMVV